MLYRTQELSIARLSVFGQYEQCSVGLRLKWQRKQQQLSVLNINCLFVKATHLLFIRTLLRHWTR